MLHKADKNKFFQMKSNKKPLKEKICLKFKEFCEHSSLHGFYYFYSSSSFWIHLSWCLVLLSSTALCGFLSHMIWEKYALNPTFTIVETTQYATEKVPFPALSVCDPQVVYTPNAKNITNILKLRGYNQSSINEFYKSFANVKISDYIPTEYVKKMHSILEDLGYNYNFLVNELKTPCEVLLRRCLWRSKEFNCSIMFRNVLSAAGHCCQFDLPYFRLHAEGDVKFNFGVDITESLEIVVNTQKDDDILSNGLVFMYIFDSQNDLTLLDSSITLSSAAYCDVTIDVWVIDSSEDVRALSLKDRQCFLDTNRDNTASYQGCIMAHVMRMVVLQCKCLPFNYTASQLRVDDLPLCNWEKLKCVYETLDKVLADMRHVISKRDCYQKCDYAQYETKTETVIKDRYMRNEDEKTCRVTVHFDDRTCIKYRREVLYSWDQMLANLGGIFGLCLGGSFVSIIEIIWFLVQLTYTAVTGIQKQRITPKTNVIKPKYDTKFSHRRDTKTDFPFIN